MRKNDLVREIYGHFLPVEVDQRLSEAMALDAWTDDPRLNVLRFCLDGGRTRRWDDHTGINFEAALWERRVCRHITLEALVTDGGIRDAILRAYSDCVRELLPNPLAHGGTR